MWYCGLHRKVGEIRAYPSDVTVHQSRAVLSATLQVRGTVVGAAVLHPPGSNPLAQALLWQFCHVQGWAMEHHCALCLVKPHIQQGGTLGRWGLQSQGAHAKGMGGQPGTPGLYRHGETPPAQG